MKLFEKSIPVLMYHQVNNSETPSSLIVKPKDFQRQIEWLDRNGFSFLSLDDVTEKEGKGGFFDRSIALTFDDGFQDNYENAFSVLIYRKKAAALFVVVDWVGRNGFLDWGKIRELADSGITIGSHSLSHRWLPDIKDDGELEREISDSKRKVEDKLGRSVHHFCYPVGGMDERVVSYVKRAGYKAAWVAGGRPSCRNGFGIYSLRRIKVSPSDSSLIRFAVKAYGLKGLLRR